jgi:hypothetical protein
VAISKTAAASETRNRFALADYPTLERFTESVTSLERWLDVLAEGDAKGQIRFVAYNDAREAISRAVEKAWRGVIDPYVNDGRWESLPRNVHDVQQETRVYGIHHISAAVKRLTSTKLSHPLIDNMRALATELLPLNQAISELKTKIVKGRAPGTGPSKPGNPNKVVKTCACCFRSIAISEGKMVHHGYQRPGGGRQTESCWGIRFPPLEVSSEGLVWILDVFEKQLADADTAWADRNDMISVTYLNIMRTALVTITRDMPEWEQTYQRWLRDLEHDRFVLQHKVKEAKERLAIWKPEERST